ncbi:MAG: bifunctional nuclease domain-containing protein [bacterium]|nr:bifunctional nuclease domain-containing protein [bacterium]
MQVAVRVDRVTLDTSTNRFVVILRDDVKSRWLPIVVGTTEAQAIALQLEGILPPRPLTHDLMKNLLESINVEISKIIVNDLRENTYYAVIHLKLNKKSKEIDARPSDAIALALRVQAPVFVEESVMRKAAVIERMEESELEAKSDRPYGEIDHLEELNIKLQKAVREERFEDAARIRDEIIELKHERHQS